MPRSLSFLTIACFAGGCPSPRDRGPLRPRLEVEHLKAHAGATALHGNTELVVSTTQDSDKPGPIRMSHGRGAIARTIDRGWVIGVVGAELYFLRPAVGSDFEIARVGLTGEPIVLATVPREEPGRRPTAAVTGTGTVGVIARTLDPAQAGDGSVLDRHAADLVLIDASRTRRMPLLEPAEYARIVANPRGPELVAVASYNAGMRAGRSDSWIALIDSATATVTWKQDLVPGLIATDGEVAFTDHDLVMHHRDDVVRVNLATGARTVQWKEVYIDARNLEVDPSGKRVAFTQEFGTGHGAWVDPGCNVRVLDDADPELRTREPLEWFKGGCYFGMGLLWVDGALWIAPAL